MNRFIINCVRIFNPRNKSSIWSTPTGRGILLFFALGVIIPFLYSIGVWVDYHDSKTCFNVSNYSMGCVLLCIYLGALLSIYGTMLLYCVLLLLDIFYKFIVRSKIDFIEAYSKADQIYIDSNNKKK
jgi:hypothetical protein